MAQVSPSAKGIKPGVIFAEPITEAGTYCHLRFPAIQPETLTSNKPLLKTKDSGDIVDFYGPCDHDPLGYDEVRRQRVQNARMRLYDAKSAGVRATPTFLLGVAEPKTSEVKVVEKIEGAEDYFVFQKALDDLLSTQK